MTAIAGGVIRPTRIQLTISPARLKVLSTNVIRLLLLAAATWIAFRQTFIDLAAVGRDAPPNLIVMLAVPVSATIAACGLAVRGHQQEPPIHDRQVDVIVAVMGLLLSVSVFAVLVPVYHDQFGLLRPDLFAMWSFVISGSILLFGLRTVFRYRRAWLLPLLAFPLPYHLLVVVLGDTRLIAGGFTVMMVALATHVALGSPAIAPAVSGAVGVTVFTAVLWWWPALPITVQVMPGLAAVLLIAWLRAAAWHWSPGRKHGPAERPPVRSIRSALPLLITATAVVASLPLGVHPFHAGARPADLRTQPVPAGWTTVAEAEYPWVDRLFGDGATLFRQQVVAETGNPLWDKQSRPRTVIVDTTTTWHTRTLEVYPAAVLYGISTARWSSPRTVELGHGTVGSLYSIVDDRLLVTWNILQWNWESDGSAQRVTLGAVDNHEPDAPFPQPTRTLLPTVSRMVTVLFRGEQVTADRDPVFKDADMLTQLGRDIVGAHAALGDSVPPT